MRATSLGRVEVLLVVRVPAIWSPPVHHDCVKDNWAPYEEADKVAKALLCFGESHRSDSAGRPRRNGDNQGIKHIFSSPSGLPAVVVGQGVCRGTQDEPQDARGDP